MHHFFSFLCWFKNSKNVFLQAFSRFLTIRVFICICPSIVSGILVTMWRHFSYHLVFRPSLWLTFEGQKQKFAVRSRSNFFSNFGHLFSPFNPVFYSHFKIINYFEIRPKLMFLWCFFHGTIFFAQKFLLI